MKGRIHKEPSFLTSHDMVVPGFSLQMLQICFVLQNTNVSLTQYESNKVQNMLFFQTQEFSLVSRFISKSGYGYNLHKKKT